jgi:hypothetical protein
MRWIAAALALGCGAPDGTDTDTTTDTTSGNTYPSTWDGVEQLYVDHCDICHPSISFIDLHTETLDYVIPGDAENSILWQDVSGMSTSPMPQSGLLPLEDVAHVKEWIEAGAVVD